MNHLLVKVTDFTIVGDYTLRVEFDDGTAQMIDFEPVLHGYYFGPLRDLALFNQVRLDPEIHTPVSYTHLDVYKRQGRGWRRRPPGGR